MVLLVTRVEKKHCRNLKPVNKWAKVGELKERRLILAQTKIMHESSMKKKQKSIVTHISNQLSMGCLIVKVWLGQGHPAPMLGEARATTYTSSIGTCRAPG